MTGDRDNPLALSSKKPCRDQKGYGRELERLRADLEVAKTKKRWAREELSVELRRLREEAEREQQRALKELTARRGYQQDGNSNRHRYLLAKEVDTESSKKHSKVDSTRKKAFCFCSRQTYTKLEQLLLTLYKKINGEQAAYKLRHRQEFEIEKAIFLCHLLEAHGRLLQGVQKVGPLRHVFKSQSRKPSQEDSNKYRQTTPLLTQPRAALQRPHSAPHSPKSKTEQDQWKRPSSRTLCAADPCVTAAVSDTCQSSSQNICHTLNTPHAGWGSRPSSCTESSGSEESSPSKCMKTNMEVSNCIFPAHLFHWLFLNNKTGLKSHNMKR